MRALDPVHFRVLRLGLLTTVQDLGRVGFQRFGMPVGGAMDTDALRLANRLVGNPDQAAGLEITVKGPQLLFERDAVIALTGADLSPMLETNPAPLWTAIGVRCGSMLTFGDRRFGARAYLAVAGGIDVPLVLGSRATHLLSRAGGFAGRPLDQGDELTGGLPATDAFARIGHTVPAKARRSYSQTPILRVVPRPVA